MKTSAWAGLAVAGSDLTSRVPNLKFVTEANSAPKQPELSTRTYNVILLILPGHTQGQSGILDSRFASNQYHIHLLSCLLHFLQCLIVNWLKLQLESLFLDNELSRTWMSSSGL